MNIDILAPARVTIRGMKLQILDALLHKCKPDQVALFRRRYPSLPRDAELFTAIEMMQQYVKANRARESPATPAPTAMAAIEAYKEATTQ